MSLACKTIADYSGSGVMPLLYSIRDCIPLAFIGLIVCIFIILFAGQYFLIKNRTGRAKILIALLSSSFFTMVLSLLLAMAQLLSFLNVLFWGFLTIVIFILFELSDNS